ncbi:MAG TPA: hypothetical protein PKD03_01630 [Ignavibacteriaceae bacterium]|nr:hypothetical protein [Ignavibacteriaceae bacterium]
MSRPKLEDDIRIGEQESLNSFLADRDNLQEKRLVETKPQPKRYYAGSTEALLNRDKTGKEK